MKKLLIVAALLAAVVPAVRAQEPSRLYSTPTPPPREVLERLRLKESWTAMVPMSGRRDGLFSAQLLPSAKGQELLVQTRSGGVFSYDAATGRLRWSTRVGVPYRVGQPVGYNRDTLFVINNIELIALDRATGRVMWEYDMPGGAVAPPTADDEQVYLSLSHGRLIGYLLPKMGAENVVREEKSPGAISKLEAARANKGIDVVAIGPLGGAIQAYRNPRGGPQPIEHFSYVLDDTVEQATVPTSDRVLFGSVNGRIAALIRSTGLPAWKPFATGGRILVPLGQHDETAYVASNDFNVYAVSIGNGRVFWRYTTGGLPTDRPAVLDEDVYAAVDQSGLLRLDRAEGELRWRNADAARFLAANPKFVYATDRNGRLVVIDRARGTTLSRYDGTRDFAFPVQNELTDRIYLAANDGLIVCLHERDAITPHVMKTVKERAPLPPPGGARPGPIEPKDEGTKPPPQPVKPKDKDKDKDKGDTPEKP
jgi:outer membrane protein assembly factor BamB